MIPERPHLNTKHLPVGNDW